MINNNALIENENQAEGLLLSLGIKSSFVKDAVWAGEAQRKNSTDFHPSAHAGYVAWSTTFASLCETLVLRGWRMSEEGNLPSIVHPSGNFQVCVTSGDANTGNPLRQPKSRNPKGAMTSESVERNVLQLELFPNEFPNGEAPQAISTTWFLVFYSSGTGVSYELSLPKEINASGYVCDWATRVIFDTFDSSDFIKDLKGSFSDQPEIVVPVERR